MPIESVMEVIIWPGNGLLLPVCYEPHNYLTHLSFMINGSSRNKFQMNSNQHEKLPSHKCLNFCKWLAILVRPQCDGNVMTSSNGNIFLCEGNPPSTSGFPSQRPVTRSLDVFFDMRLKKRLSKQSRHRRFETPWRSLRRHCNECTLSMGYNDHPLIK